MHRKGGGGLAVALRGLRPVSEQRQGSISLGLHAGLVQCQYPHQLLLQGKGAAGVRRGDIRRGKLRQRPQRSLALGFLVAGALQRRRKGLETESLDKKSVAELLKTAPPELCDVLNLRQQLAKSSVRKYQAMEKTVCEDGRARGMFQFYRRTNASQLVLMPAVRRLFYNIILSRILRLSLKFLP